MKSVHNNQGQLVAQVPLQIQSFVLVVLLSCWGLLFSNCQWVTNMSWSDTRISSDLMKQITG